jgi:hypothetical protein
MGMISPGQDNFSESFSTLKFANRTKKIKNKPKINEELDQEMLIRKYEEELKRLRKLMLDKRKGMGNSKLLQLEEEKERAEQDKNHMLRKLQEQSQKFLEEREEKRKLKIKINHLQNQLQVYKKVKQQFGAEDNVWDGETMFIGDSDIPGQAILGIETQLKELEQQKAHLNQYKDLLRRQRDIMVALTNKLNERDEAILQLQDELEAFDKIYIECEQLMLYKNSQLKFISQKLKEKGMKLEDVLEGFQEDEIDFKSEKPTGRYSTMDKKEDLIQQNLKNLVFGDKLDSEPGNHEDTDPRELKKRIDLIMEELTGKKEPENLEHVAKDLLGLQMMIHGLGKEESKLESNESEPKFILNLPEMEQKEEVEQRWSEKFPKSEVDMKKINYESLFEKTKLVRKETEEEIRQFDLEPRNDPPLQKKQTYNNILSKFEEIKNSFMDFSKKSNEKPKDSGFENVTTSQGINKKQLRRPKSSAIRQSKTKTENKQIRRKSNQKKNSFSSSRARNKSFSSSKFENSVKTSARKQVGNAMKKGSFLTRKSGGFNEVNSKLQSILSNGKKTGYLERKYSMRGGPQTEKKVEGLLRENNILNMMPRVSNLK